MKKTTLHSLILAASLSFTGTAYAQDFSTDLGWLNQALRNTGLSVRSVGDYQKFDHGKKDYTFPEEKAPWGANYYPMMDNGIANRWQIGWGDESGLSGDTSSDILSEARARSLSAAQIALLSPAEKLDLYLGNYNFKITKRELRARGPLRRPEPEGWEGFCNGVRIAGVLAPEPVRAIDVQNAAGQTIRFEPSDLKALAGAAHFYVDVYNQIGSPTRSGENKNLPNAGVFDIALRTMLGANERAFVIDVHSGSEIWNETVMGYERELYPPEPTTASERRQYNGATQKVTVVLSYLALGEFGIQASNGYTRDRTVRDSNTFGAEYILYLDSSKRIVDGKWLGGSFPDFAWFGIGAGDQKHSRRGQAGNPHMPYSKVLELLKKAAE